MLETLVVFFTIFFSLNIATFVGNTRSIMKITKQFMKESTRVRLLLNKFFFTTFAFSARSTDSFGHFKSYTLSLTAKIACP